MEIMRPNEKHSPLETTEEKDTSRHGKIATSRGAPTSWGPQREGPVTKGKGSDGVKGTHLWRPQRENMRTSKPSDLTRGTHELGIAEQGHAKCFGVGILEIIEASGEAFHCGCR